MVSHYRRRWGLLAVREFARHRVRRVPYIGMPRGTRFVGAHGDPGAADAVPLEAAWAAREGVRAHGAWQH